MTGYTSAYRESLRVQILELLGEQRRMRGDVLRAWFLPSVDIVEIDMAITSLVNMERIRLQGEEYRIIEKVCCKCGDSKSPLAFRRNFNGNLFAKCNACIAEQISASQKRRHALRRSPGVPLDSRRAALRKLMSQYIDGMNSVRQQMDRNGKLFSEIIELMSGAV